MIKRTDLERLLAYLSGYLADVKETGNNLDYLIRVQDAVDRLADLLEYPHLDPLDSDEVETIYYLLRDNKRNVYAPELEEALMDYMMELESYGS